MDRLFCEIVGSESGDDGGRTNRGANLSESAQGGGAGSAMRPDLGLATFVMSLSLVREEELAGIA